MSEGFGRSFCSSTILLYFVTYRCCVISAHVFLVFLAFQELVIPVDLLHCEGLPRRKWVTKCVTLLTVEGVRVAKGICHCVDSSLVFGSEGPLGEQQVAVQISTSLCEDIVPSRWAYSMHAWPISKPFTMDSAWMTMLGVMVSTMPLIIFLRERRT